MTATHFTEHHLTGVEAKTAWSAVKKEITWVAIDFALAGFNLGISLTNYAAHHEAVAILTCMGAAIYTGGGVIAAKSIRPLLQKIPMP